MRNFPYALPNLFFAVTLGAAGLGIILGLDETHPQLRRRRDRGRALGKLIMATIMRRKKSGYEYEAIQDDYSPTQSSRLLEEEIQGVPELESEPKQKSSFRTILTRKVCLNMAQRFLQSLHVSSFNSMFFSLLPAPQANGHDFHLPFRFGGGLAQSTSSAARIIGPTMGGAVLGWGLSNNFVGLPLWTLAVIALANWVVILGIEDVNMHQ